RYPFAIDAKPKAKSERIVAVEIRALVLGFYLTVADELLGLPQMSGDGARNSVLIAAKSSLLGAFRQVGIGAVLHALRPLLRLRVRLGHLVADRAAIERQIRHQAGDVGNARRARDRPCQPLR